MGTRIEAAATSHRRLMPRGSLYLSDKAARDCLHRANYRAEQLDLLINAGIYKTGNTAEPALAAIIQEDIGANRGSPIKTGHHGTFAFDIVDGPNGVIQAAQLVDGFVGQGRAKLAMIVAADADPSPGTSRHFPFVAAGGALLIAHVDGDGGFHHFKIRTYADEAGLFQSQLRWDPDAGILRRGRNVIEVFETPEFAERCVTHSAELTLEMIGEAGIPIDDIDLLITSQYPKSFGAQLARRLGIPADRVPTLPPELRGTHTAGPIAALEAAIASNQFAKARHTLFVTAGAGITISAALYRS